MKEANHIDTLYQDSFHNFEQTPDPKVWLEIEKRLQQKKRRIFPFWWLSSGVASLVVLGLFLYPIYKVEEMELPITSPPKDTNVIQEEVLKKFDTKPAKEIKTTLEKVVTNTNTLQKNRIKKNHQIPYKQELSSVDNKLEKQTSTLIFEDNEGKTKLDKKAKESLLSNKQNLKTATEKKTPEKPLEKKHKITKENKKELVAKVFDEPEINKKETNKWEVSPIVGLLKANSFTNVSAIDSNLNNNPVSGENTVTYGIKIGYNLNDKWTIQSGFHLQKLEYNTSDVTIAQSLTASDNLENVKFAANNLLFGSSSESLVANDAFSQAITDDGVINQTYSYIEFPIELKYKILSIQNFSTQLVSGFSTLILNKNKISAISNNNSLVSGEATNLNNVNFSGNLGLEFNYEVNKKWSIHINPMFKTQLKTFSNSSNDFKPYFIGVYSGLQYKF